MRRLHLIFCILLVMALPGLGRAMPAEPAAGSASVASVSLQLDGALDEAVMSELKSLVSIRPGDKFTRRELSRTLTLLYATGRFSDVSADIVQTDAGVELTMSLIPRRFIPASKISFEGNKRLDSDRLFKALKITSSSVEYFQENAERMAASLKDVYARIGYNSVQVTPWLDEGKDGAGDGLVFTIEEGTPTRLKSIAFSGSPAFKPDELIAILGLGLGDVAEQERLKTGIDNLKKYYRGHDYFMVRFGQPDIQQEGRDGDARLIIPISAGLPVDIAFSGQEVFSEGELRAFLDYSGEDRLTESLADELAARIQSRIRLSGFPDAKVTSSMQILRDVQRVLLLFTIQEGTWLRVTSVQYSGVSVLDRAALKEELEDALIAASSGVPKTDAVNGAFILGGPDSGKRSSKWPLILPEEIYAEQVYKAHAAVIRAHYLDEGYLSVETPPPIITKDTENHTGDVVFNVTEGIQTLVEEIDVEKPPEGISEKTIKKALHLHKGQPFSAKRMTATKDALAEAMRSSGYLYSGVQEKIEIVDGGAKAHVYFELFPGPRVHLGKLVIRGHNKTSENVIRLALAFKEGDILTQEDIQKSQRTLVRLGIFRSVRLSLESPDLAESTKDLTVLLDERNTWLFSVGFGYSLMDGVRLMSDATKINLFGQALQLQLQGKLNFLKSSPLPDIREAQDGIKAIGRRLNVGLTYPHALWLLPLDVTLRTNLLHEYLLRPSYTFQQTAGIIGADFTINSHLTFSLQYEIDEVIVNRLNQDADRSSLWIDRERLRFEEGRVYMHSVRPLLKLDFRDNTIFPRYGFMLTGQVELVKSLTAPDDEIEPFFFLKVQGQANVYLPLPAKSVLALSLSAGRVFPMDSEGTSRTIVPKRFFVGGAASQRGFMDDGMVPEDIRRALHAAQSECALTGTCEDVDDYVSEGGELFTLARAEIRIPLGKTQFELAFFFDAGNLWLDRDVFEMWSLRYSAGVGIRMLTPIGPASLDIGINLDPDEVIGEPRVVPHFSIGMF